MLAPHGTAALTVLTRLPPDANTWRHAPLPASSSPTPRRTRGRTSTHAGHAHTGARTHARSHAQPPSLRAPPSCSGRTAPLCGPEKNRLR